MAAVDAPLKPHVSPARTPYAICSLVGLGGLFAGITGPLLSAFVPPLVRDALGEHRAAIGAVMAIDNVLLLLLVPWTGAVSDRFVARGRGRLPIALAGIVLASAGMALVPAAVHVGIAGLIVAMVVLYTGINVQRSPVQALVADLVPSRYRTLATGSFTFQMCVGAILFLMLGRALGMRPAFLMGAGALLGIAAAFVLWLREPAGPGASSDRGAAAALVHAVRLAATGAVPGMRAIFASALLLQLTFQTFTTWYALHATERFGMRTEDATVGFIAWAVGGVIGALPAGAIGVRIGRRNAMLLGFALMTACLVALDRVASQALAVPLLVCASASWTLPTVNAYPLFVEPVPSRDRGVLAALFLVCIALGGAIGDPLNGVLFDAAGSYRPLFRTITVFTALAFLAVLLVPRGGGEAGTGPDSDGERSG
jgi:MFS family permease